jgi:hypothetical protein
MILECKDLERALRTPELMPDMRAHAETCAGCREQLYLWKELSRVAPQLHADWESPTLWPRIRAAMAAEAPRPRLPFWRLPFWKWSLATAALAALALFMIQPWTPRRPAAPRELLTENALAGVEQAEAAYVRSIDRLSAVAAQSLNESPSPAAALYREKLQVLDSAIAELKSTAAANRYNTYLRTELASLYRQKQETLRDWLQNAKTN